MDSFIYLNNAATSWPKAPGVAEAIAAAIQAPPILPGRDVSTALDPLTTCRQLLAERLAVPDPSQIVLTPSATIALNLVFLGLGLRQGQLVVTTQTEHNSVLRPLYRLREKVGIELEIIGVTPGGDLDREAYQQALKREPALVVINHASNVTGLVQPVEELFAQAHAMGARTLLDASQSMGHIPVHPLKLQADMVAFPGHKGLLGPVGTGGLYVIPGVELEPVLVGGTGIRSDLPHQPPEMPIRLETGTPDIPSYHGLVVALEWLARHEAEYLLQEQRLTHQLWDGLREITGLRLFGRDRVEDSLAVISIKLDGLEVEETGYILQQSFGVECRTGLHCAPLVHQALRSAPEGTVRLSLSGFNMDMEIKCTLDAFIQLTRSF